MIVAEVFRAYGYDTIITEGSGGQHMEGSKHYAGFAVDLRSKHINSSQKRMILDAAKPALSATYDFILENEGHENEHYHLEYDPR